MKHRKKLIAFFCLFPFTGMYARSQAIPAIQVTFGLLGIAAGISAAVICEKLESDPEWEDLLPLLKAGKWSGVGVLALSTAATAWGIKSLLPEESEK